MITVLEVIKKTADFLSSKGVESSRLNAEVLVGHALGLSRMKLYLQFERILTEPELEVIRPMVRRRGQREPLQYIIGHVDFCGIQLKVDKRALIPRPETEYFIDIIRDKYKDDHPKQILDLGTGSGAIALALAHYFPNAQILAIDASTEAIDLARENTTKLNLHQRIELLKSIWFSSIKFVKRFDLIVSNPPYLSKLEVEHTQIEVKNYEPHTALISNNDGLEDIEHIITNSSQWLSDDGMIALETGENQHQAIGDMDFVKKSASIEYFKDLAGNSRFVFIKKNTNP